MKDYSTSMSPNPGDANIAPIPTMADRMYSAPRSPAPCVPGGPPGVVSVNYSPNVPTPGGATNGGSKGK
jgi:hypothetical protein